MAPNRKLLIASAAIATLTVQPLQARADPADNDLTIESLLKDGWQIAGYTGAVDNWSAFILFRNPAKPYLVQCRSGYDVTRQPRTQSHCYQLH